MMKGSLGGGNSGALVRGARVGEGKQPRMAAGRQGPEPSVKIPSIGADLEAKGEEAWWATSRIPWSFRGSPGWAWRGEPQAGPSHHVELQLWERGSCLGLAGVTASSFSEASGAAPPWGSPALVMAH